MIGRITRRALRRGQDRGDLPAGLPSTVVEELIDMVQEPILQPAAPAGQSGREREKDRVYAKYGYLIFLGPFH
ncbi:MAG: hypothetical protein LRS48_01900 [Desulfurococcales archaeon]|nr:hypothetical protein [Desulfurococcales archaeon]